MGTDKQTAPISVIWNVANKQFGPDTVTHRQRNELARQMFPGIDMPTFGSEEFYTFLAREVSNAFTDVANAKTADAAIKAAQADEIEVPVVREDCAHYSWRNTLD